jgi:hypothetical protein
MADDAAAFYGGGSVAGGGAAAGLAAKGAMAGSGPRAGVLEVSDRVRSVAAVKNFRPNGQRDFVWDPATGRFATGADQGAFGHDGLRTAIGASEETVVGGRISRGADGQLVTNEWSGHYGYRWNDQTRDKFVDFMKSHGIEVEHQPWKS